MQSASIAAAPRFHPGGLARLLTVWLGLIFAAPAVAAVEFDDAKLDAFVEAAVKVEAIKSAWLAQAQSATDEEQLRVLNEKAQAALVEVVEATPNMSVDDYNAIVDASKSDQALRERITTKLEQKAAEMEQQQKEQPGARPGEPAPGEPSLEPEPEQPKPM